MRMTVNFEQGFRGFVGMRPISTLVGVVAVLLALLNAPLFHFHDHDDHGNPASLLHAHFWESAEVDDHASPELETPHSHASVRWIDVFACKAPSASFDVAIVLTEELLIPSLDPQEAITIASVPQAHGPPGSAPSRPRSPPSI